MGTRLFRDTGFHDRLSGLQGWRLGLAGLILGGISALGHAPFEAFPAFMIALGLLVIFLDTGVPARRAFLAGFSFGYGHFLAGMYWVGISFAAQSNAPLWMAPFAVLLLAGVLALFPALAMALAARLWRPGWSRHLVFALSWAGFEYLRGTVFTGLPWNLTAYIWAPATAMIQTTAWLGSYGLGLVTLVSISLMAGAATTAGARSGRQFMAGFGILLVLFTAGFMRLALAGGTSYSGITLRIVQAAVPQVEKWDPALRQRNLDRHIRLSRRAAARAPDVIIWPESAIPYIYAGQENFGRQLVQAIGGHPLIAGLVRREAGDEGDGGTFNSIIGFDEEGNPAFVYDKFHLVPFGEYLPWKPLLSRIGLRRLAEGAADFSEGPGPRTVTMPGLAPVSPMVCYEIIFPGRVTAGPRPGWILNLTNDAWFGTSTGPYQHFTAARFRAVEEGLPVVRAAGTGISGVVDPLGRVIARLGLNKEGVLDASLPMALPSATIFANFGNRVFLLLFLAGFVPIVVPAVFNIRQSGRD